MKNVGQKLGSFPQDKFQAFVGRLESLKKITTLCFAMNVLSATHSTTNNSFLAKLAAGYDLVWSADITVLDFIKNVTYLHF